MTTTMKKSYQVTIFMKNYLQDRVVLVPFNSDFRSLDKAMKEVRRVERSPQDYAKVVVTEYDVYKGGMRVQSSAPMVHVIDAEFLSNYSPK